MIEQKTQDQSNDLLRQRVEEALDKIRPAIEMDGGSVELGDIINGTAYVYMHGACGSCPFSSMTLKEGIEKVIKDHVPEIQSVESV